MPTHRHTVESALGEAVRRGPIRSSRVCTSERGALAATEPDTAITTSVRIATKVIVTILLAGPVNQLGGGWQYGQKYIWRSSSGLSPSIPNSMGVPHRLHGLFSRPYTQKWRPGRRSPVVIR